MSMGLTKTNPKHIGVQIGRFQYFITESANTVLTLFRRKLETFIVFKVFYCDFVKLKYKRLLLIVGLMSFAFLLSLILTL